MSAFMYSRERNELGRGDHHEIYLPNGENPAGVRREDSLDIAIELLKRDQENNQSDIMQTPINIEDYLNCSSGNEEPSVDSQKNFTTLEKPHYFDGENTHVGNELPFMNYNYEHDSTNYQEMLMFDTMNSRNQAFPNEAPITRSTNIATGTEFSTLGSMPEPALCNGHYWCEPGENVSVTETERRVLRYNNEEIDLSSNYQPQTKARRYNKTPYSEKSQAYLDKRQKNNEAVRRSRAKKEHNQKKRDEDFRTMKQRYAELLNELKIERAARKEDRKIIEKLMAERQRNFSQ